MRNRSIIAILSLVMGSSTLYGAAFAHGTEKHGNTSSADAQMKKMHALMPLFSVASAKLEVALEKGDLVSVEAEAGKILAAIPDLQKSKPHKNIKQQKNFVKLATNLEKTVITTLELAKKGDFAGAKTAFNRVEVTCAACHAKFRD